jgi:allantoicase
MSFTALPDLAAERLGGTAIAVNDEFFAARENLLKETDPVFKPDVYTEHGKWMDGWETRRRREPGHDWCLVRLGAPGIIRGIVVDTTHFRGNHPEACSIEACAVEGNPSTAQLDAAEWTEIVPRTELEGDKRNLLTVRTRLRFTHLRLRIYPDGGVARLRVHGEPLPRWGRVAARGQADLAAADLGGRIVAVSDDFFASQHQLLLPGPARNMGDGWETRRRRGPGHDWIIVHLAARGRIREVVVDTSHYKGNAPASCSLEAVLAQDADDKVIRTEWHTLLPDTPLQPHTVHRFAEELTYLGPLSHVRLNIYPDGGVARLRLYGEVEEQELQRQGVRWLDALPPAKARQALLQCCGSERWARQMLEQRPFRTPSRLTETADAVWADLAEADWREAFAAHPRIGEGEAGDRISSQRWSSQEQAAVQDADEEVRRQLAEGNKAYEQRFGHVFLICATGKTASEMLQALRTRLDNSPEQELSVAGEEQRQIMQLRLEKMLTS